MEPQLFIIFGLLWAFTFATIGWIWCSSNLKSVKEMLEREQRWGKETEFEALRLRIKLDGLLTEKEKANDHPFTHENIQLENKIKKLKQRKAENVRSK